jgi:hypothetical protein
MMFRVLCATVLAASAATAFGQQNAAGPPMPFHEAGVCPSECCIYREWTALKRANAWRSYDETGSPRVFAVTPGERLTAMSGIVITSEPGVVRIVTPTPIEVTSRRFPRAPAEKILLETGDTLYILARYAEGELAGWSSGRLLERVGGVHFLSADQCRQRPGWCAGIVEREPESAWWVKVRNARGQIGWVRGEGGFKDPGGC